MWTETQVRDDITGMFQAHAHEGATAKDDSHITGDLGLDSLAVMEVVSEIEDRYGLMIPDDALPKMRTIADVVAAVVAQLRSEGRAS